jgi:hypothetical protein
MIKFTEILFFSKQYLLCISLNHTSQIDMHLNAETESSFFQFIFGKSIEIISNQGSRSVLVHYLKVSVYKQRLCFMELVLRNSLEEGPF